jgi:hypothetical protein
LERDREQQECAVVVRLMLCQRVWGLVVKGTAA